MKKFILPILDYYKTRKRVGLKFIAPILVAGVFLLLSYLIPIDETIKPKEILSSFISVQVSMIAVFISFSIAIISILVSADNPNIQKLRETESKDGSMKMLDDKSLTLFQVLLSNLTYNVFIEVFYLIVLIVFLLLKAVVCDEAIRYFLTFGVFYIVHILQVLLETVIQMYHTFWRKPE